MRKYKVSLLLSLILHLAFLGILLILNKKSSQTVNPLELTLSTRPPEEIPGLVQPVLPEKTFRTPDSGREGTEPVRDETLPLPNKSSSLSLLSPDSLSTWKEAVESARISDSSSLPVPEQILRDSLLKHRFPLWIASPEAVKAQSLDPVGDEIKKQAAGGYTPLMLGKGQAPAKKEEEPPPPSFNFIPTEDQLQALDVLLEEGKSTQVDLYARLDPRLPLTAELFNRNLEALVNKGFLKRRKISPENLFHIVTPLGAIPLELSKKNRINPVYEYQPQISREHLIRFLESRLYLLTIRQPDSPADSSRIQIRKKDLEKKIQILIREPDSRP